MSQPTATHEEMKTLAEKCAKQRYTVTDNEKGAAESGISGGYFIRGYTDKFVLTIALTEKGKAELL